MEIIGVVVSIIGIGLLMLIPVAIGKYITKRPYLVIIGYLGIAYLVLFFLAVTVPYHFQGYSELSDKCSMYIGKYQCPGVYPTTLGWTKNSLIGFLSYFLGSGLGIGWLTNSILFISHGHLGLNKKREFIIKTFFIVYACFSLEECYRYQMLSDALE